MVEMRLLQNTESDLEQADRLLMAAYRPPSWRRELEADPGLSRMVGSS